MYFNKAFSLLELILVLLLLGALLSFGIPRAMDYVFGACNRSLQLQVFNLKVALNNIRKSTQDNINITELYKHLDMKPSSCYFEKQNNGMIGVNGNKKVYFVIKNNILECQHTKSSKLHNGESYCDIF